MFARVLSYRIIQERKAIFVVVQGEVVKIYLVGGAIRDALLGMPVVEQDWVVVGAEPESLLNKGFLPVGKDFPVFLHPKTQEEYALARTERKVAPGYAGFQFHADSSVTLAEDLQRRDLTINAIAQDEQGQLIDPFNGQQDINKRCLRHVSAAFIEDPVRVLRIARFAAKLVGFTVAAETQALLCDMVKNGEVDALVPERVWKECSRALLCAEPWRFFEVLADCYALAVVFPKLIWSTQKKDYLQQALSEKASAEICFALLLHDLTESDANALCQLLKVPKSFSEQALLLIKNYPLLSEKKQTAESLLLLLKKTDALRRPERFMAWLKSAEIIDGGKNKPITKKCHDALAAVKEVSTQVLQEQGLSGQDFLKALDELRVAAIAKAAL